MKFMLNFTYPAGDFLHFVKTWGSMSPQERASFGEGVKKLGHWHDVVGRAGVVEAKDLAAVACWAAGWHVALVDFVITPVLDDEEAGLSPGKSPPITAPDWGASWWLMPSSKAAWRALATG